VSTAPTLSLDALDASIAPAEKLLRLSRECGYVDLISQLEHDVRDEIIPTLLLLMSMVDPPDRKALAVRLNRLRRLLR
jgi:hypothetical protein